MSRNARELLNLIWDLINVADPKEILEGKKLFRPFLRYQKSWLSHFHPGDTIKLEMSTWSYLQKYVIPLIYQHASSWHVKGIQLLKLDTNKQPDFNQFKKMFRHESKGFSIEPVKNEIPPKEYFALIRDKKFPCIESIRSHEELFCANEPDFWHEAIGHIAPLCFREVQDFYLEIADYMLSAKNEYQFQRQLAVAWTLSEYAFIKEQGQNKMFGAALVGSHLAHRRYLEDIISVEAAERSTIINSGFFDETTSLARDDKGKLRFFCLDSLKIQRLFSTS